MEERAEGAGDMEERAKEVLKLWRRWLRRSWSY
jgi:hypothetical protein